MSSSVIFQILSTLLYFHVSNSQTGYEGYVVIAGGRNETTDFSEVLALDLRTRRWHQLPSLPINTTGPVAVTDDSGLYVLGGDTGKPGSSLSLKYDRAKKNWNQIAPLLQATGAGPSAATISGQIHLFGGNNFYKGVCVLEEDSSWVQHGSTLNSHCFSGTAVLNGILYVCGAGASEASNLCEKYDHDQNIWSSATPMQTERVRFGMVSLNGYLYAVGGSPGPNERYNHLSDSWELFQPMLWERYSHAVTTDGVNIYAVGGETKPESFDAVATAEVYMVELDLWQEIQSLPYPITEIAGVFVGLDLFLETGVHDKQMDVKENKD